jgi:DNA-binding transcriptional MerR regulator/methylmalonyl-CoA mutase cobalamin-binding subunit
MSAIRHPIKIVAQRTGLSPHLIRIWEKRYATIRPERSDGNQRLYSDDDIERLALLKQVVDAGHSIRIVAVLGTAELRALTKSIARPALISPAGTGAARALKSPAENCAEFIEHAFGAVSDLDTAKLEWTLEEASVALGQMALLNRVIAPLVHRIGEAWRTGALKVAHGHLATAVIRTFLGHTSRPMAVHPAAPTLLVTTPAGQLHELGAVLVAACAAAHGWRVTYLGPSLPAEEIAGAAKQGMVRAVALSVVHPEDDSSLPGEVSRLRRLLPPGVALLAGGRACLAYRSAFESIRATVCGNLDDLSAALEKLRSGEN